jgi:tetratricopeptide (TPR) repeat protein
MKKILIIFSLITSIFAFDALYTKAFMAYKKGLNLELKNPKKAQQYFQQAYLLLSQMKAETSQKYYMLGRMYCNGWGVPQDLDKAEEYFKKALKLGNQRVHCCLARLYIKKGDLQKARKYLQYALSHESLSFYCRDINPKTLKINTNIIVK